MIIQRGQWFLSNITWTEVSVASQLPFRVNWADHSSLYWCNKWLLKAINIQATPDLGKHCTKCQLCHQIRSGGYMNSDRSVGSWEGYLARQGVFINNEIMTTPGWLIVTALRKESGCVSSYTELYRISTCLVRVHKVHMAVGLVFKILSHSRSWYQWRRSMINKILNVMIPFHLILPEPPPPDHFSPWPLLHPYSLQSPFPQTRIETLPAEK